MKVFRVEHRSKVRMGQEFFPPDWVIACNGWKDVSERLLEDDFYKFIVKVIYLGEMS
jgi:hypothetical protein